MPIWPVYVNNLLLQNKIHPKCNVSKKSTIYFHGSVGLLGSLMWLGSSGSCAWSELEVCLGSTQHSWLTADAPFHWLQLRGSQNQSSHTWPLSVGPTTFLLVFKRQETEASRPVKYHSITCTFFYWSKHLDSKKRSHKLPLSTVGEL